MVTAFAIIGVVVTILLALIIGGYIVLSRGNDNEKIDDWKGPRK